VTKSKPKMLNYNEQFFKQLEKSQQPLIVFSGDWKGDAVASALAIFLLLKKIDKKVEITAINSAKSSVWSFLPGSIDIKNELSNLKKFIISLDLSQAKVGQVKYSLEDQKLNFIISPKDGWFKKEDVSTSDSGFKNDLIIVIGASDLESLGKIYEDNVDFFYKTTIINIDCHPDNEEFGQINIVDINSAAISEIIFNLFQEKSDLIDEDIATCLLAGIISNTKNFRTTNLTPRALLNTSKLISLGGRREEIIEKMYRCRNFKTLKLWGKVLNNLHSELNGKIIWSMLKKDDFQEATAAEDNLLDIIDELIINIPEAKIITIIFEDPNNNKIKILLYSVKNINALEMLSDHEATGSSKIASVSLSGELKEETEKYLQKLSEKVSKISK
jgi:phosphoesterase RecJ-like protein